MTNAREVPNDMESERAFLGSILLRSSNIIEVGYRIKPSDLYETRNQAIYSSMLEMSRENVTIDLVTLHGRLRDDGVLEEVGGGAYLSDLVGNVPTSTNIEYYARNVKAASMKRSLILAGEEIVELGFSNGDDINSLVEKAGSKILKISEGTVNEDVSISSAIVEFTEMQRKFEESESGQGLIGIASGFSKLDSVIDGLRPGHFWVIGGYTSTGKTWFLLNILNRVMTEQKVAFFSLEMSRVDIVSRMLAIETGTGATKILRHEFPDQDSVAKFQRAKERLVESKLSLYSKTVDLDGLIMAMTREIIRNQTTVFAIDYIQLIRTKSKNEYEQISETSQRLQNFAREHGVTILVLSQISNEHARDPNGEVMGFKGGGTLPASVDLAIELFNEDKKEERDQKVVDMQPFDVKVIIKKNRHGRTGNINMEFTPWNGQFSQSIFNDD